MSKITRLPSELLLDTMKLLSAKDLTRLLQTCRKLYSFSSNRIIWLDQMERLITTHHLCRSSFNLSSMSTLELRRAAGRPYRFDRSITRRNLTRRSPLQVKSTENHTYTAASLLPGGRWLVTLSTTDGNLVAPITPESRHLVRVWDLERPTDRNFKQVARKDIWEDYPIGLGVRADDTGYGAMVFVFAIAMGHMVLRIYHFDPRQDTASDRLSLVLEQPIYQASSTFPIRVFDDIVVLGSNNDDSQVLVWNWREAECGLFKLPFNAETCLVVSWMDGQVVFWSPEAPSKLYSTGPISGRLCPVLADDTFPTTEPVDCRADELTDVPDALTSFSGSVVTSWHPSDQHSTLLYNHEIEGPIGYAETEHSQDSKIRFLIRDFGFKSKPVAHVRTIRGNIVIVDAGLGLTTLFESDELDTSYQTVERDIVHSHIGPLSPFICPYTGVLGAVGVDGDIFLWQQK